jgi:hypothetical protein
VTRHKSLRLFRRLSWIAAVALCALPAGLQAGDGEGKATHDVSTALRPAPRGPEPTYKVSVGFDGEVFPVFANYSSMLAPQKRDWGLVNVTISNPTDAGIRSRISVQVPGWSDREIQIVELGAGEVRTVRFSPTFHERLYRNREIAAATAEIEVSTPAGQAIMQTTAQLRLRSADDMYWGSQFKYAPFIASWVTPHDLQVEKILSKAKEFAPQRRLPGYEVWKSATEQEKATSIQARAIYNAIKRSGLSYVKSSTTFGNNLNVTQRVRMPKESLNQSSANCIDASVMFASLFENLGMDPVVVLVPGHAYVGVRVARGSQRYLFIDVALTGRATYESAVHSAESGLAKYGPSDITRISIDQARDRGIYPMP